MGLVWVIVATVSAQLDQYNGLRITAHAFGETKPLEPFWSTQPLGFSITPPSSSLASQNNSALMCASVPLGRCMFNRESDDQWLEQALPMWSGENKPTVGLTIPFTRNVSAVRMLGGIAIHDLASGTYTPLPDWDLAYRTPQTGVLVYNWTRMESTLDPFVTAGIIPSPFVLDNVPYAFVSEPNRFYGGFGLGSAPDNTTEFGEFVEALAHRLVNRYGIAEVSGWRFRLGTEADGLPCRVAFFYFCVIAIWGGSWFVSRALYA